MQTLEQLQSGKLLGCTSIKLSCGLIEFPKELFDLVDTLELLDLSGNKLSSLPSDFGRFTKLKIAFFSDNQFTEYPEVLANCPLLEMIGFKSNRISIISEKALSKHIRWLILTNNCITHLPKTIGHCSRLQKVALAGNQLTALPKEMAQCVNLELLRISANHIIEFPTWLLTLPKLSWLAFSDNPCCTPQLNNKLHEISWNEFEIGDQLGEGASGIISKALWTKNNHQREVAIKVFKGEVTSDGLPLSEINSCVVADKHEHLVKLLGKITGHPQQKEALVFDLIPATYKNLGKPPSFITCTRDTYPDNTIFTLKELIQIALATASVLTHLHDKGMMHGDLYAHNIMINDEAHILLGDFGAATIYSKQSQQAEYLEKLDVRAFGCLLEDLLERLDPTDKEHVMMPSIYQLKQNCMHVEITKRPYFTNVQETLKNNSLSLL